MQKKALSAIRALSELPDFSHVATRKLQDLQERGYSITGYAIEKPVEGSQPERGFITAGGFVGWWRGDDEWNAAVAREVERRAYAHTRKPYGRIGEWRFGGAEKKQN